MPPKNRNQGQDDPKSAEPVEAAPDSAKEAAPTSSANLLPVEVVADQVLMGRWGNPEDSRRRLSEDGYDVDAVEAEVKRRKERGAPSAY